MTLNIRVHCSTLLSNSTLSLSVRSYARLCIEIPKVANLINHARTATCHS